METAFTTARPIVDLSHWQRPDLMNWPQAQAAGIVGLIAKATQGSSGVDPALQDHLWNAWTGGLRLLGGYHFLDDSDPALQAQHFLDQMNFEFPSGLDTNSVLLALDLEGNPAGATETVAGAAEVADHIHQLVGRWPLLYMGRFGPDGAGTGLPNETLSKCDLWLPAYGQTPRFPKGFTDPTAGQIDPNTTQPAGGIWRLWQDTDGQANSGQPVPGLGLCDQSRVVGFQTLEELTAWWGH